MNNIEVINIPPREKSSGTRDRDSPKTTIAIKKYKNTEIVIPRDKSIAFRGSDFVIVPAINPPINGPIGPVKKWIIGGKIAIKGIKEPIIIACKNLNIEQLYNSKM